MEHFCDGGDECGNEIISYWFWIVFAAYVDKKRELQPMDPLKVAKQTTLRSVTWNLEADVYYKDTVAWGELH